MTVRLGIDTRLRVEQEAERLGRSLAQIAEERIERSFREVDVLGGPERARALKLLSDFEGRAGPLLSDVALAIELAERSTGCSWHEDAATYQIARIAMQKLLDLHMPLDPEYVAWLEKLDAEQNPDRKAEMIGDDEQRRFEWRSIGEHIASTIRPTPTRHPGHVNEDGTVSPVFIVDR